MGEVQAAVSVLLAYYGYSTGRVLATWLYGFVALLFNPLVPVHLDKQTWQPIDIGTGVLFVIGGVLLRPGPIVSEAPTSSKR